MKFLPIIILAGVLALGGYLYATKQKPVPTPGDTSTQTTKTEIPTTTEPDTPSVPAPTVFYPMTNYESRVIKRHYGQQITSTDRQSDACGDSFSGLHNGDDLEVTNEEINKDVAVFAIADGKIRRAEIVGGYGGLIVIEHTLNGETVTVYYGHVDIIQANLKVGASVTAGKQIAILGDQCSNETSNERKHLHFAIRKGSSIDVTGYVPTQGELLQWYNPKELLKQLGAATAS